MRYINVKVTNEYGEMPYAITNGIGDIIKGDIPKKELDKIETGTKK